MSFTLESFFCFLHPYDNTNQSMLTTDNKQVTNTNRP